MAAFQAYRDTVNEVRLVSANLEYVDLEDCSCLQHFSHEGRHPPELAVARPHPGKDAIPDGNAGLITGDKAAHLRHQHIHPNLQLYQETLA